MPAQAEGQQPPPASALLPPLLPWARALIEAADGPILEYGSAGWQALPDNSRAKVASCVLAAESWRTYLSPEEHARRLHAELDALREYEEPAVWSPEIVAEVHCTANRPTFAELSELRGEPERAERARWHERRVAEYEITGDDEGASTHAPARHIDGRPVRYRAPLRLVPTLDGGAA